MVLDFTHLDFTHYWKQKQTGIAVICCGLPESKNVANMLYGVFATLLLYSVELGEVNGNQSYPRRTSFNF